MGSQHRKTQKVTERLSIYILSGCCRRPERLSGRWSRGSLRRCRCPHCRWPTVWHTICIRLGSRPSTWYHSSPAPVPTGGRGVPSWSRTRSLWQPPLRTPSSFLHHYRCIVSACICIRKRYNNHRINGYLIGIKEACIMPAWNPSVPQGFFSMCVSVSVSVSVCVRTVHHHIHHRRHHHHQLFGFFMSYSCFFIRFPSLIAVKKKKKKKKGKAASPNFILYEWMDGWMNEWKEGSTRTHTVFVFTTWHLHV